MGSVLYWVGGTGRMGNAANWSGPSAGPEGQRPQGGDQVIIGGGSVFAMGPTWSDVNVTLIGQSASGAPSFTLQNGVIGAITVNSKQYSNTLRAYGHVEIQGRSAAASGIHVGSPSQAVMTLSMNIADNSAFVNVAPLTIENGSSFSTTRDMTPGVHNVSFENHSSVVVSGDAHAVFGTKITAGGTISVTAAAAANTSFSRSVPAGGGHIEFKGSVAADQSIEITQGTVQVDQPMLFLGVTSLNAAPASGAGTLAGASMSLMGVHAATAELNDGGLFLRGAAGNLIADIRVKPPAGGGAVFVANQADGSVSLTGYALSGASEVHVSAMPVSLA